MTSLAALYRRVSTDDQSESLANQDRRTTAYAELQQLEIRPDLIFEDEDVSGGKPIADRPGGARLLRALENGVQGDRFAMPVEPVRHVIVTKLDRLGRNLTDLAQFWDWCREREITLHILDCGGEPISTRGIAGRLMYTILGAFAEFERGRISERTQEIVDQRFSRNQLISGTIPYGWRPVSPDGHEAFPDSNGRWPEDTFLQVDEIEAEWLRKMHHQQQRFGWSPNKIAQWLNHQGVPTKEGLIGRWQTGNVKRVLTSKHAAKLLNTEPQPA